MLKPHFFLCLFPALCSSHDAWNCDNDELALTLLETHLVMSLQFEGGPEGGLGSQDDDRNRSGRLGADHQTLRRRRARGLLVLRIDSKSDRPDISATGC